MIVTKGSAIIAIEFELIELPEINHFIEAFFCTNPNKTLMILNHPGGFVAG